MRNEVTVHLWIIFSVTVHHEVFTNGKYSVLFIDALLLLIYIWDGSMSKSCP